MMPRRMARGVVTMETKKRYVDRGGGGGGEEERGGSS